MINNESQELQKEKPKFIGKCPICNEDCFFGVLHRCQGVVTKIDETRDDLNSGI